MLAEIRRFYEELNKFWIEEIRQVVDALEMGRIDPRDLERWNNFHSSLQQTIEFWKVLFPPSTMHYSTDQKVPVLRIKHRTAMLEPYTLAATTLQFVHSLSTCAPLD